MDFILKNEFWLWVVFAVITVIVGKKTGKTVSQWIQSFFGQTIDYAIMILIVFLIWKYPLQLQQCDKLTILIRGIVVGHWFWHENSGGLITRSWLLEKVKMIWSKIT